MLFSIVYCYAYILQGRRIAIHSSQLPGSITHFLKELKTIFFCSTKSRERK